MKDFIRRFIHDPGGFETVVSKYEKIVSEYDIRTRKNNGLTAQEAIYGYSWEIKKKPNTPDLVSKEETPKHDISTDIVVHDTDSPGQVPSVIIIHRGSLWKRFWRMISRITWRIGG